MRGDEGEFAIITVARVLEAVPFAFGSLRTTFVT
jgi:hypothetical protein